jgi:hypothetical protein
MMSPDQIPNHLPSGCAILLFHSRLPLSSLVVVKRLPGLLPPTRGSLLSTKYTFPTLLARLHASRLHSRLHASTLSLVVHGDRLLYLLVHLLLASTTTTRSTVSKRGEGDSCCYDY